jgi:heat shock protein HslJ
MPRRIAIHTRVASGLALVLIVLIAAATAWAQQTTPTRSDAARKLEGSRWRAIELAGKPTPARIPERETYLEFQPGGGVSGSDGCNRVTGSYRLQGDRVTFAQVAATQMICLHSSGTEEPFREALKNATRMRIAGDRLELFDASGARLAVFSTAPPPPSPSSGFAGTSWQLVKFQSMDDTVRTPDDRSKYTIEFEDGGKLTARIDCNRGIGTWATSGESQIEFGPLALTRAQCPPDSLHDQIVRQWPFIRSYVMRDEHLFLALMADGGIYEFEPIGRAKPPPD